MKVVIVGGVAGGASAAARLRRLDEQAEIVLLERGEYISYANCGLPYYIGNVITDEEELTLQTPESFRARFRVDVRVGSEVTAIHREEKTVTVRRAGGDEYTEPYDTLILAPGAEPIAPPVVGERPAGVFTLRTVPDTMAISAYVAERAPKTAVVVGGGFVGLETAENLMARGIDVTLFEQADQILPQLDRDMACCLARELMNRGLKLYLNTGVQALERAGDRIRVRLAEGELETDLVLFAAGVRPESALARDCGLVLGSRGHIVTDSAMRTSDPAIYAVGDAVEVADFVTGERTGVPLAGPANKQGRIAADNICGIPSVFRGTQGSSVIKLFDLTCASTGIGEKAAARAGIDCDRVYLCPGSHASYYPDAETIAMKVLFQRETGKILGAQLFGRAGVDKRCDVLATAIRAGMTADDLAELELCYAPPYSSAKDPVNMAGFMEQNLRRGLVKQFYWDDVAALPRDGSVTLLDVRTPGEYRRGHLDGFVNIPVDELRGRLGELPKDRFVYLNCQSAIRSYIASRILLQNGYDCSHLAGGWFFYSAITAGQSLTGRLYPCGMEK